MKLYDIRYRYNNIQLYTYIILNTFLIFNDFIPVIRKYVVYKL